MKNNAKPVLKEHFKLTVEGPEPVKQTADPVNPSTSSNTLIDNAVSTSVGMATGYFVKKIVVRKSSGFFRKILGYLLQAVVTNVIARNPGAVKSSGRFIAQHIPKKKGVVKNRDR
jgi:hypothetical protein